MGYYVVAPSACVENISRTINGFSCEWYEFFYVQKIKLRCMKNKIFSLVRNTEKNSLSSSLLLQNHFFVTTLAQTTKPTKSPCNDTLPRCFARRKNLFIVAILILKLISCFIDSTKKKKKCFLLRVEKKKLYRMRAYSSECTCIEKNLCDASNCESSVQFFFFFSYYEYWMYTLYVGEFYCVREFKKKRSSFRENYISFTVQ